MKKILLIILLFFAIGNLNAQSTIDIIRASNLYTEAVSKYRAGNYNSALEILKKSENNLKGKTNSDLEYLKIMTLYKLNEFEKSYDLIQKYFENEHKDRTAYYRNIETYDEEYEIDYDEKLTQIFVDLEDKNTVVTSMSSGDVISTIVTRIKTQKKDMEVLCSGYIKNQVTVRNSWTTKTSEWSPSRGSYYEYENHSISVRLTKKSIDDKYNNIFYKNEHYCVNVTVELNDFANVDLYGFKYGYKLDEVRYSRRASYKCATVEYIAYKDYGTAVTFEEKVESTSFLEKNNISDLIKFSAEEQLILKRGDNLQKLKEALKQQKLL